MIITAEMATGNFFSYLVTEFLGSAQGLLVVPYCSFIVAEGTINFADSIIGK